MFSLLNLDGNKEKYRIHPKIYKKKGPIMTRNYIPGGDTQFQALYEDFSIKLTMSVATFGLTGEEVAEIQASFEEV